MCRALLLQRILSKSKQNAGIHTRWRTGKVATIEIQFCHLYNINCEHSTDATRGLAK